jgi:hypothetical protein
MLTNKQTSLAAGGLLGIAVGYSLVRHQLRSRAPAKPGKPAQPADASNQPTPSPSVDEPSNNEEQELQDVDGGVSARPTARLHDEINDHYDAVNYDNLGSEYLTRATQATRRELEPESLDLSLIEMDIETGSGGLSEASYQAAQSAEDVALKNQEPSAADEDAADNAALSNWDAQEDLQTEELRTR